MSRRRAHRRVTAMVTKFRISKQAKIVGRIVAGVLIVSQLSTGIGHSQAPEVAQTSLNRELQPVQFKDDVVNPQHQELNDPTARAGFTWSVPERYAQSWAAWNPLD